MSTVERALTSFRGADAGYFGTDGSTDAPSGTNTVGKVYGSGKPTAFFMLTTDPTPAPGAGIVWDSAQIDPESFCTYPNAPGAPWVWQVPAGIYQVDFALWTLPLGTLLNYTLLWGVQLDVFPMAIGETMLNASFVRRATANTFFALANNGAAVQLSGTNQLRRCYLRVTRLSDL